MSRDDRKAVELVRDANASVLAVMDQAYAAHRRLLELSSALGGFDLAEWSEYSAVELNEHYLEKREKASKKEEEDKRIRDRAFKGLWKKQKKENRDREKARKEIMKKKRAAMKAKGIPVTPEWKKWTKKDEDDAWDVEQAKKKEEEDEQKEFDEAEERHLSQQLYDEEDRQAGHSMGKDDYYSASSSSEHEPKAKKQRLE